MNELSNITKETNLWDLIQKMVKEMAEVTERNKILQEQNTSLLAQVKTLLEKL